MAEKTCPQCSETVADAKAFCPACGHAFVDEQKRAEASKYEQADHTMQMGQTMYNSMLSDMGLNVKKEPEKRVEVLKPVAVQPAQTLQPVAGIQPTPALPKQAQTAPAEKKSNKKIWIISIAVALLLLLVFAAAVIAVGVYLYFYSGRF